LSVSTLVFTVCSELDFVSVGSDMGIFYLRGTISCYVPRQIPLALQSDYIFEIYRGIFLPELYILLPY
jgi:hypothetical protein